MMQYCIHIIHFQVTLYSPLTFIAKMTSWCYNVRHYTGCDTLNELSAGEVNIGVTATKTIILPITYG